MSSFTDNLQNLIRILTAHNYMTVITHELDAPFVLMREIEPYAKVSMISPSFSFQQAFEQLASNQMEEEVLIIPEGYRNPITQSHLYMFMTLWKHKINQMKVPRLLFVIRNAKVHSSKEHVYYFPPRKITCSFDKHFDATYDKEVLSRKVRECGDFYKKNKLVIVPEKNFLATEDFSPQFLFMTEEEALYDHAEKLKRMDISVVIDLCMRKITYASLGGGIRYVNDVVGSDFLDEVESVPRTLGCPLYRLIDQENYNTYHVVITHHYLLPFALSLMENDIPFRSIFEKPEPIFYDLEIYPISERYRKIVGPLAFHFLDEWEKREGENHPVSVLFAAMLDCLDHSILEYEDEQENAEFFEEHFLPFRCKDSLGVFTNVWNEFVSSTRNGEEENFSSWLDGQLLYYSKFMEFYNTYTSLLKYITGKEDLPPFTVSPEDLRKGRRLLKEILPSASKVEENIVSNISQGLTIEYDYQGERVRLFKNLLFDPPSSSITPVVQNDGIVKTFIYHE